MFLIWGLLTTVICQPYGPGRGPWEEDTPESQGLDRGELAKAAAEVDASVGGRVCNIVVKNGKIVHEQYYRDWTVSRTRDAWSCTKSFCASLFGVGVEQGWADVNYKVADHTQTRQCNREATFQHVLTMTGQSSDINNPRFSYDTTGDLCLDTLSDYIHENNVQGLNGNQWRDQFYMDKMGFEHGLTWSSLAFKSSPRCGYGVKSSCRDLARAAQLWANEGAWPGEGQMMNQEYVRKGRTWVYPGSGTAYGYTVWLEKQDEVDPQVHHFNGMFSQCAYVSKEHEAVIVSMGNGPISGSGCDIVWQNTKHAIVSKDHPSYNSSSFSSAQSTTLEQSISSPEEIRAIMDWYLQNDPDHLLPEEIAAYKEWLRENEKF